MNSEAASSQGRSWSSYLAILLVGLASLAFILHHWANFDVFVSTLITRLMCLWCRAFSKKTNRGRTILRNKIPHTAWRMVWGIRQEGGSNRWSSTVSFIVRYQDRSWKNARTLLTGVVVTVPKRASTAINFENFRFWFQIIITNIK
jgi:hypothetical protein